MLLFAKVEQARLGCILLAGKVSLSWGFPATI
jgi:hypothetical protein